MELENAYQEALQLDSEERYSDSIRIYSHICKTSNDPRHWMAYGHCLQKLNHWKQSVPVFERAIELKPHYCEGDTRLALADSYIKTNQKEKAIGEWKICSNQKPEYPSYDYVPDTAKQKLKQYV